MLTQIADEVFVAEHVLRMPGGARLPTRMTVIRDGGSVAIVSPIKMDDALAAQIDALGDVQHIIAPNAFHHLYFRKVAERWPSARTHGVGALLEKRPDLRFDEVVEGGATQAITRTLEARLVDGAPRIDEAVLFHGPSRTLIVTDLVFNVVEPENFATSLVMRLMGCHRRLAQSRAWSLVGKDRAAALRSMEDILRWPYERLVPAHGEIVEHGAREKLLAALRWTRPEGH